MPYTVGSVPFLNARPLVAWFEDFEGDSPVQVLYDLPSNLPSVLESGAADAVLVSSIDALTTPGRSAAEGVCIGTRGAAESVRLFSKKPFERIERVSLDASSMTSNALAQIVLAERFGIRPEAIARRPDLDEMLTDADAALLIGDKGLLADGAGLRVLDLGEEWAALTGLPFVWALWIGEAKSRRLTPELSGYLRAALDWAETRLDRIADDYARTSDISSQMCRAYLGSTMNYTLEDRDLTGLREFGSLVRKHGFGEASYFPELVPAAGLTPIGHSM